MFQGIKYHRGLLYYHNKYIFCIFNPINNYTLRKNFIDYCDQGNVVCYNQACRLLKRNARLCVILPES